MNLLLQHLCRLPQPSVYRVFQNKIPQHDNIDIYVMEEYFTSNFSVFSTYFITSLKFYSIY